MATNYGSHGHHQQPQQQSQQQNTTKVQDEIRPVYKDERFWAGITTLVPFFILFLLTGFMLGGSEQYFSEIFDTTFAGCAIFAVAGIYLIVAGAIPAWRRVIPNDTDILIPHESIFPFIITILTLIMNILYMVAMTLMYFVIFIQEAQKAGESDTLFPPKVYWDHIGMTIASIFCAIPPIVLSIFALKRQVKSLLERKRYHLSSNRHEVTFEHDIEIGKSNY